MSNKSNFIDGVLIDSYYFDEDDYIERVDDKMFHVGQSYTNEVCSRLKCKKCGSDRFYVGQDDYFTAIKCPNCNYEISIHEG